jgi:hypothetical protein
MLDLEPAGEKTEILDVNCAILLEMAQQGV